MTAPAVNRIRLLPDHVANQIAAGEVVERPASVVKELVENALDAGATRLEVEIAGAGRGLIRVSDDGCGMSRDDALLCLERHATSKIAAAADLARVTTMGFRGEAVPSIASVARFTLTTREHGPATPAATQIVIHGGKILEVKEAGAPPGTTVEVRGLFFNLPARRRFLRSDETERGHIQHWLTTAALAHPGTAFALTMEGRLVWHLPALPAADAAARLAALRERLRLLLGDGLALLPVDATAELEAARIAPAAGEEDAETAPPVPLRVWGWIGAPGVSRATRADQHLFVNRRPVENRGLNAALLEGCLHSLMKGRYPLACLFLELDPAEVDVNIHPAKREVKFHRERAVRRVVADAVRNALAAFHRGAAEVSQVTGHKSQVGSQKPEGADASAPVPQREAIHHPPSTIHSPRLAPPQPDLPSFKPPQPEPHVPAPPPPFTIHHSPLTPPPASPTPLLAVPLRLVGVVGRLYVVLESDRGLVLMDQHAAHERVLFEQMLRRVEQGGVAPSQRLLLPETVEVSPRDAAFLRENAATLARLGVGLREFGERTFLLEGLPPFVRVGDARRFALELVDELKAAGAGVNAWRLGELVVARTVCRHAVKANDPLARPELEALLEDLRRCEMPYTCPHGRPTLIEMNFRELEKKFGRVTG